jgi:hypothetical protein
MNFEEFEFNGDWEYKITLPKLAGFQERNGAYTSISSIEPNFGIFSLVFEDDLSENSDPYPEQLNTLKYIFENQESITNSIIDRTLSELPEILMNYGLDKEEEYQNISHEKIKSIIGFSSIFIKIISKENFAYFDISGGCNWDEEHGLNLLFHKDKVVSFSGIDGGSTYQAEKDGGTFKNEYEPAKPQKHLPSQKYSKLKPCQKYANETFEIDLISKKHNAEFISGVEKGEIDVNGKWKSQDKSFLEAACWYKNNELVKYLLGKKADIRYALHQCVGYGNNPEAMELLLEKSADINFPYGNGNTIVFEVVSSMESIYRANDYYKEINRLDLITDANTKRLHELKERVQDLILKGADPNIKNNYGQCCFDIMRNSKEDSRKEVNDFLTKCLENRKRNPNNNNQWWKFWQ